MKVNEAFPSRFLKSEDLKGRKVAVTIKYVEMEKVGEDTRPVITFVGKDKVLTLNKTNSLMIAKIVGTDEMDEWSGAKIVLRPDVTTFGGKPIDCIRVEGLGQQSRLPHQSASLGELLRLVATAPAPDLRQLRPASPPELAEVVARLLAKRPAERPASGIDAAVQMSQVLATWPGPSCGA